MKLFYRCIKFQFCKKNYRPPILNIWKMHIGIKQEGFKLNTMENNIDQRKIFFEALPVQTSSVAILLSFITQTELIKNKI